MRPLPLGQVMVGDARQVLDSLPEHSVDCVITSPPYYRLRNYQHDDQIGLEAHVEDWVRELRAVARKIARVLKEEGAFWLSLGDTFSRSTEDGALPKSLVLAPERLALALIKDGWILRNKVVWAKTNPMPTSVRDRLSCTHEYLYFFVRRRHYYFDLDAIRMPHVSPPNKVSASAGTWSVPPGWRGPNSGRNEGLGRLKRAGLAGHPLGKNPGDVWRLATAGYRGQHHAVFPERLVERPLLASCPEKVCSACGKAWTRRRAKSLGHVAVTATLAPNCPCKAGPLPGVVLDPFIGSGTVAVVAERHKRDWMGIDINPTFSSLVAGRLGNAPAKYSTEPARSVSRSNAAHAPGRPAPVGCATPRRHGNEDKHGIKEVNG